MHITISSRIVLIILTVYFLSSLYISYFHKSSSIKKMDGPIFSSVWCSTVNGVQLCSFKNLCFSPLESQFLFIMSPKSIISGISREHFKNISLSSLKEHNAFHMKINVLKNLEHFQDRKLVLTGPMYLISRFKMDNIMHVIHDDLLPLFNTYSHICQGNVSLCVSYYQLSFLDQKSFGSLLDWYDLFSIKTPIVLTNIDKGTIICSKHVSVGLLSETLWYQYGFKTTQGPIEKFKLDNLLLNKFTRFVIKGFHVPQQNSTPENIVFFNRKITRKILNEGCLRNMMIEAYNRTYSRIPNIYSLDLSVNDSKTILSHILNSKIVVGMHGAAMIFCIFLQPGSVIAELFPFGINPKFVSSVRVISSFPCTGFFYYSWVNENESNSITHPEATPLLGGIVHLPVTEQIQIVNVKQVPAVKCCHDPTYLYRMFQDTVISEEFRVRFQGILKKQQYFSLDDFNTKCEEYIFQKAYFPGPVNSIICFKLNHQQVKILWNPPINIVKNLIFKIMVVSEGMNFINVITNVSSLVMKLPDLTRQHIILNIWIKSCVDKVESIDVHKECEIILK